MDDLIFGIHQESRNAQAVQNLFEGCAMDLALSQHLGVGCGALKMRRHKAETFNRLRLDTHPWSSR